jgi:hypothetical protein
VPRGEALTLRQTWDLSKAWYDDRLSPSFRGRTAEEAATILGRLGLGARSGGRDLTTYFLSGAVGPCLACAWSSEPAVRRLGRIRKGRVLRRRPPGAEIGATDGERSVARGRSPSR